MKNPIKVIDSLWTLTVAVFITGPFALPLLWRNPRFSRSQKTFGTLFILALTALAIWLTQVVVKESYQNMKAAQTQLEEVQ